MISALLYFFGAIMLGVAGFLTAGALYWGISFLVLQETEAVMLLAAGLISIGLARLIGEAALINANLSAIRERLQMDANRRG